MFGERGVERWYSESKSAKDCEEEVGEMPMWLNASWGMMTDADWGWSEKLAAMSKSSWAE